MSLTSGHKLILAFVTLIIGVVLVGTVATQGLLVTDKKSITDESQAFIPLNSGSIDPAEEITLTNAPTGWKSTDCPLTNIVVGNSTDDFTITTDYTITASTGVLLLVNSTTMIENIGENTTLVDYTYCGDDYMNLIWGRTTIDLVPGFFALALLLVSVWLFYSVAKDEGVI